MRKLSFLKVTELLLAPHWACLWYWPFQAAFKFRVHNYVYGIVSHHLRSFFLQHMCSSPHGLLAGARRLRCHLRHQQAQLCHLVQKPRPKPLKEPGPFRHPKPSTAAGAPWRTAAAADAPGGPRARARVTACSGVRGDQHHDGKGNDHHTPATYSTCSYV